MSTTTPTSRRDIRVEALTRVEGEGGLSIELDGDRISSLTIDIYEPPRFFEAFLNGRHYDEVADITARICGICPVAYQMSAVHAIESAFGVTVTPEIRSLRRLLYCAEWIQSHALHIYLLNAPDFLGYESALALAKDFPKEVETGLRLKKIGNRLLEVLGGRASHPVSVCVGGFYKAPRRRDLLALRDELLWAVDASRQTLDLVTTFAFPSFEQDYEFVSLFHPDEYPMNERKLISSKGLRIEPSEFEKTFLEEHVSHSTALHSIRVDTRSSYFVGPLARVNLNSDLLMPPAREAAKRTGMFPSRNPFTGIVARAVELIHACDEAAAIISAYQEPATSRVAFEPRPGEGCAATEAPRGVLYHRYRINSDGLVEFAKIVPPTAQNYRRMEDDLRMMIPPLLAESDETIRSRSEQLIRAYDPCISCSTHFLKLSITRR
jgi:sulfhydrogenase subunit alpha